MRKPAGQYKYDMQLSLGSVFFVTVTVDFKNTNDYFLGYAGGLAVGAATTWGTAWLNYPIQDIVGWAARFDLKYWAVATSIDLWGMHGEFIGTAIGGGLGIGAGVAGGQGSFKSYS